MAEARTEDEEESLRESRGGRTPRLAAVSSERSERNKPEQRHSSSQGALSSIRAAIKRTSNRTAAQTDHNRDRRRPEITILSAEPLATNSWFPGASGAFPPPPPPAQPSWASTGLTVHLPPPSYEQVIREKSREQNLPPPAVSSSSSSCTSSSSSPTSRRSTVTIATQTDTDGSKAKNRTGPPARRPPKPPRPSLPLIPKPAETSSSNTQSLIELEEPAPPVTTHTPATTHGSDILSRRPLSEQCGVQTDFSNVPDELAPLEATPALPNSSHNPPPAKREDSARPRPRPRPRSKAILPPVAREEVLDQPMTREVKVQTLVRLKDDGAESVFAGFTDSSSDVSSNKYLQELLDAFAYDEQGFQGEQSSESDQGDQSDQSEKSEEEEAQEEKDDVASESSVCATVAASVPSEPSEPLKRPEPRPRTQNPKPVIVPKPSEPVRDVQEVENASEDQSKPEMLNHPVPAPRPLLTNRISEENKPDKNTPPQPPRPPVAARRSLLPSAQAEEPPSGHRTPKVPLKTSVDDQHVEEQARNSSSAPVKPTPVTSASSSSVSCPPGPTHTDQVPTKPPSQRRPPPSSTTNAQAAVGGVIVSKASASSVPSLPPRPREGKVLPLRPPPMKLPKSAGSSHVPATTNQHPSHRVPKRGPPLPPRPKLGHPLYKEYTSKVPQGDTKMTCPGTEPEKHCLQQKEELLLDLDDTHTPTQTPHPPREVKGLRQDGRDDVCPAVKDEPVSQQKRGKREQQEDQQPQPNTVRFVSRFAFEGERDELTFREGDVITLIEYVNEEWGRGSLDGHTGLFPLNFVQEETRLTPGSPAPPAYEEESRTGRAMYDFTPESEDELCLKVGDIVCALEEVDEEWYMGEFGGKRGIVPKNYIQVL